MTSRQIVSLLDGASEDQQRKLGYETREDGAYINHWYVMIAGRLAR